jgi:5-methyltetrahydrofolate--homocysteine methyltransferase
MADYHLEDIVYELNYESAKIAREVADEFTAKTQIKLRCSWFSRTNKQNSEYVPDVNDPDIEQ